MQQQCCCSYLEKKKFLMTKKTIYITKNSNNDIWKNNFCYQNFSVTNAVTKNFFHFGNRISSWISYFYLIFYSFIYIFLYLLPSYQRKLKQFCTELIAAAVLLYISRKKKFLDALKIVTFLKMVTDESWKNLLEIIYKIL